jgi:DNA-binding XRE family transcriptional regulator
MSTKNKRHIQQTAAAKAGISERSGRRIEKGESTPGVKAVRHWRTRKDPFKNIWENEVVPMLEQNSELQPLS